MTHILYYEQYYIFLKNAEIVRSVDKDQPPLVTLIHNALNVIRDLCCCKQTVYRVSESVFFVFFLTRPMRGAVADRVFQSFKPSGC